jgi:hypothetical protein
MVYHPGKVLKVFKEGKTETQATMLYWDENINTVRVSPRIAGKIKTGDLVLVDYYPSKTKPHAPNLVAIRIVPSRDATEVWQAYKKFFRAKKGNPAPKQGPMMPKAFPGVG